MMRRHEPAAKVAPLALSIALVLVSACGSDGAATTRATSITEPSVTVGAAPPDTTAPDSTAEAPTSSTAPAAPGTIFEPALTEWQCPADAPSDAECHRIELPADWDDPGGQKVSLPIVVIPPTGADLRPDAIVVPAGGPGGSSTAAAKFWSDPYRDIVLYDQRGAGQALPSLDCPERNEVWLGNLQRADSFEVERAAIVEAYSRCRTRLEAAGVDFDDYDTEANVRDLDAIRTALGYDEWNIYGASYGARLALAAMRSTPDGVRSVILDSVYDVTSGILAASRDSAERAFTELALGCSENPTCAAAHPNLAAEIDAVDHRYNDSPIEVQVDLGGGTGPLAFVITGDDILGGLFDALYDPALIPLLPQFIGDLRDGNTAIVAELIRRGAALQGSIAWAMYLSTNCADNAGLDPATDEAALADPGRLRLLLTEPLCSQWPVEPTSDTFNEPVVSDIPALVVAGRYDPITPPDSSQTVAGRLTNSTFALWPDRGHGVAGDACANDIMSAFLDDPSAPVDLACLTSVPDPAFG